MIDLMLLLWYFLAAQPPERLGGLLPWHLLALLAFMGVLSAFGIHFLMGHVAGFYRRRKRIARWISFPSLLILLISVQLLLGAYLLGVEGSRLVSINRTDSVVNTLGANLLEPAFDTPALAESSLREIPKTQLKAAFKASTENRYREALANKIVTPDTLTPFAQAGRDLGNRQRFPLGERILVQVGMRWITAPHETWWAPLNPGGAGKSQTGKRGGAETKTDQGGGFFLPIFLEGLLGELADDVQLSRANWENVAGTRFVEGYLQPVMMEYLAYFAIAMALAVLLIDILFFLAMGRIKRIGLPRPEKAAPQVPAAAEDSALETTVETTVETALETTVKSLPDLGGGSKTETSDKVSAKTLPAAGADSNSMAANKISVEIPAKISGENSDEISAAFPRTGVSPVDRGAEALPSSTGDGGAVNPKGEPAPQSANPKAGGKKPGELLLEKEQKTPEPAGIVKKQGV